MEFLVGGTILLLYATGVYRVTKRKPYKEKGTKKRVSTRQ